MTEYVIKKYRVTNITRDETSGNVILRIISDTKPTSDSVKITPTLEDYYLYVFEDAQVTA